MNKMLVKKVVQKEKQAKRLNNKLQLVNICKNQLLILIVILIEWQPNRKRPGIQLKEIEKELNNLQHKGTIFPSKNIVVVQKVQIIFQVNSNKCF